MSGQSRSLPGLLSDERVLHRVSAHLAQLALDTPCGAWVTVLYYGLLLTGAVATSHPLRSAPRASGPHDLGDRVGVAR